MAQAFHMYASASIRTYPHFLSSNAPSRIASVSLLTPRACDVFCLVAIVLAARYVLTSRVVHEVFWHLDGERSCRSIRSPRIALGLTRFPNPADIEGDAAEHADALAVAHPGRRVS